LRQPLGLRSEQWASGTAWQPALTAMSGHSVELSGWHLMLHYNAFAGAAAQATRQRRVEGFTTNWVMGMAERPLGGGVLSGRAMLSFEPLFLGTDGYPLLMQTGETSGGLPLVDRQHPHDLFMEVALRYARPLTERWAFELYAAPAGEPALGPVAFPHRASAMVDPFAPLSHHWQDSTHISFGVVTAGLFTQHVKLEGSWFNGREPDERRFDFDLRRPDSFSGRLSVNPTERWSFQASYGHLKEPEALEPGKDLRRATASATYFRAWDQGSWATSLIWGQNRLDGEAPSNAVLLESAVTHAANTFFGRVEYVQKSAHDFAFEETHAHGPLPVGALSLGYSRALGRVAGLEPFLGLRGAIGAVGATLADHRYGTRLPLSGAVFVGIRPGAMHHDP
jgi:hypothetical protein